MLGDQGYLLSASGGSSGLGILKGDPPGSSRKACWVGPEGPFLSLEEFLAQEDQRETRGFRPNPLSGSHLLPRSSGSQVLPC